MSHLGKVFGPGADQEFVDESIQVYRQGFHGGLVWVVDERDRVYVKVDGKERAIGYNHSRAWRGATNRYSPYVNDCDVEFWTQEDCDRVEQLLKKKGPTIKIPQGIPDIED